MFPVAEGNLRHDLNSGMSVARGGVLVEEFGVFPVAEGGRKLTNVVGRSPESFGRNDLVVHMNQEHWRAIEKGEHRGV